MLRIDCLVMAVSSIRLTTHTLLPVSAKQFITPARVSARSSVPFSVGDWRGVSTFSGARPLVFAKAKQSGETTIEDPIEDPMDDSTNQLVSVEILFYLIISVSDNFYSSFVRMMMMMMDFCISKSVIFPAHRMFPSMLCYQ